LLDGEVGEPVVEYPAAVEKVGGTGCEHLQVTCPAEAFVSLRAVGRYVDEVATHRPDGVVVQAVDELIGAVEPTGPLHVAVTDHGAHLVGSQVGRPTGDLGVSEAVEG